MLLFANEPEDVDVVKLLAALVAKECECGAKKVRGWMPFCPDCLNKLPASWRLEFERITGLAEQYALSRQILGLVTPRATPPSPAIGVCLWPNRKDER